MEIAKIKNVQAGDTISEVLQNDIINAINSMKEKMLISGLDLPTECRRCGAALKGVICNYCAQPVGMIE
jgi:hypothetical protein